MEVKVWLGDGGGRGDALCVGGRGRGAGIGGESEAHLP